MQQAVSWHFWDYYWWDDAKAPDFAHTVDIRHKPGYDPVKRFLDPDFPLPAVTVAWRLLQKRPGLRMLMDAIPLRPELVRSTHGRPAASAEQGPLLIGSDPALAAETYVMTAVKRLILCHFDGA